MKETVKLKADRGDPRLVLRMGTHTNDLSLGGNKRREYALYNKLTG